jgi:hypothetical protein
LSDCLFRGRAKSECQYDCVESDSPEAGHDDPERETNQVAQGAAPEELQEGNRDHTGCRHQRQIGHRSQEPRSSGEADTACAP